MKPFICIVIILMSTFSSNLFGQKNDSESFTPPLNGIVEKTLIKERRVLPYKPIREADIFWEKRVSRIIDTREKINLPFRYPKRLLFQIMVDNIEDGNIMAFYPNEAEDFSEPLSDQELAKVLYKTDTIITYDPGTYKPIETIVQDHINPEQIFRYRIKEIWFFDENTSSLNVRIIGIAPMIEVDDDLGNFLYELPLFWVHYPSAREAFSKELAFNEQNDNALMTWVDLFEMRKFSSYIYKESNVHDRRLQGYLSGVDLMLESKKINDEIFNFEHDLWEP